MKSIILLLFFVPILSHALVARMLADPREFCPKIPYEKALSKALSADCIHCTKGKVGESDFKKQNSQRHSLCKE